MRKSSQPPRTPSRLSDSVHRQLNMYALAASAAGVGMLALAQPVEARIIYIPAHRYVPLNHRLGVDLNGDGVIDFYISRLSGVRSGYTSSGSFIRLSYTFLSAEIPKFSNFSSVIAGSHSGPEDTYSNAFALRGGEHISSKSNFDFLPRGFMAGRWRNVGNHAWRCNGPWNNAKRRYLGLRFKIKGQEHFGWARLDESCNRYGNKGTGAQALLTGYAYETTPNKPIIAGKVKGPDVITLEPGSLGALAAGAARSHRGK